MYIRIQSEYIKFQIRKTIIQLYNDDGCNNNIANNNNNKKGQRKF